MAQTTEGRIKQFCNKEGIPVEHYYENLAKGNKHCRKCRRWIPTTEFSKDKSRCDGLKSFCNSFGCGRVEFKKTHKGRVSTFIGRRHTDKAKQKMSGSQTGNKNRIGKRHTHEMRTRLSKIVKAKGLFGEKSARWKGGLTEISRGDRAKIQYYEWRKAVYKRDRFTCQFCFDSSGGNLEAHHINGFAEFKKQRFWLSNGITLCKSCHSDFHKKYGFKKNTRKQFNSWLKTQK